MLLLSRGDRSAPAVSRARWMSGAWVKMCSCLLSSVLSTSQWVEHTVLARGHHYCCCAQERCSKCIWMWSTAGLLTQDMIPLSLSCFKCTLILAFFWYRFPLFPFNEFKGNTWAKRWVNNASQRESCCASSFHIQRAKSPEGTGCSNWCIALDILNLLCFFSPVQMEDFKH